MEKLLSIEKGLKELDKIVSRKIISASVSGSLFAILLGLISPLSDSDSFKSLTDYLFAVVTSTPIYMMYSFPVILIYGVLSSIISDEISQILSKKIRFKRSEIIISGILHVVFGLILQLISLAASILFFITDRIIQKNANKYKLTQAIKSLAIPLAIWLIYMGIIYIDHFMNGPFKQMVDNFQ
jgi:uncharacterized membrane protein